MRILLAIGILAIMAVFAGCAEKQASTGTTPTAGQPTTTPVSTPPPPVANAGNDQTVEAGKIMTYDASGSSDPSGGSIVKYEWKIAGAPPGHESIIGNVLHSGPDAKWTTSWVMKSSDVGQWTMELMVTDNEGNTAVDSAVITVTEATESFDESADAGS